MIPGTGEKDIGVFDGVVPPVIYQKSTQSWSEVIIEN